MGRDATTVTTAIGKHGNMETVKTCKKLIVPSKSYRAKRPMKISNARPSGSTALRSTNKSRNGNHHKILQNHRATGSRSPWKIQSINQQVYAGSTRESSSSPRTNCHYHSGLCLIFKQSPLSSSQTIQASQFMVRKSNPPPGSRLVIWL